jgi:hypothetical protein
MLRKRRRCPAIALALLLAGSISTLSAAPDLRPVPPSPDFMKRMMREARRTTVGTSVPLPVPGTLEEPEDSEFRSRQAERILRRSVRGALGDRLEPILRSVPGLDVLMKPRDLSIASASSGGLDGGSALSGSAAAGPRSIASGSVGFRLDAHPRLLLRGQLFQAKGVLEVPVLDRELRLSIDQPLGTFGTASLKGGLSADRGDWVSLSINLRF